MFKKISSGLLVVLILVEILVIGVFASEGPKQKHYYSIDVNKSEEEVITNASPQNKIRAQATENGRQALYFFIDSEKNKELDAFVEDFTPDKSSDVSKIKSVTTFFKDHGLIYSPKTEYNVEHQIENIKYGHTMCLGATMLGAKLLDKTDMEYRYVLKRKKIKDSVSISSVDGGHIALEIKTDKGNWLEFDPTRILCYAANATEMGNIFQMEMMAANDIGNKEIIQRSLTGTLSQFNQNEFIEFVVSPVYKNGKMIGNKLQVFATL